MDKFVTKRNDLLAEQVIKNLKSRQMEGHYVQTKEEALALALELIPEGSSIRSVCDTGGKSRDDASGT